MTGSLMGRWQDLACIFWGDFGVGLSSIGVIDAPRKCALFIYKFQIGHNLWF